jgi:hypothetical protein
MSTVSKVIVARPNDFIVAPFSAVIERLGLSRVPVTTPEALDQVPLEQAVGAVISLAVTSSMPLTFVEVLTRLRARAPRLPLVATSLLRDAERVQSAIDVELAGLPLVGVRFAPELVAHAALGVPGTVLVVRLADLDAPSAALDAVLRRHFGVG